ncbi:hypothetical protein [Methylocystis sp.]|uniref:hypothetical protein n=1 Tax=Methylocystis sp. TaxID=1911079 RepID=UPI003DA451FC
MCADLAYAHASIDWAVSNLPAFEQRMQAWLNLNIDVRIRNIESDPANNMLVAFEKEPMPLVFSAEFGALINSLRSSLDILATALAYRNGMANKDKVYFPIAQTEARFLAGNYKGAEFVKLLPHAERLKIEALKPYDRGHSLLWMLHHLDNTRKHRKLIETQTRPASLTTSDIMFFRRNPVSYHDQLVHIDGETELGLVPKSASKSEYKITAQIIVAEPGCLCGSSAIAAIRYLATMARDIIAKFDGP